MIVVAAVVVLRKRRPEVSKRLIYVRPMRLEGLRSGILLGFIWFESI